MELETRLLLDLFVIFAVAVIGGGLARRLGQPAVLGELFAGIVAGPHVLGLVGRPDASLVHALGGEAEARATLDGAYALLAEFGLILLLLFVGLEIRLADLLGVGGRAAFVAVGGVALPFGGGYAAAVLLGRPSTEAVFLAAALVATSTGITSRTLRDLGVLGSTEARIVLGAAVIDDLLSMVIVALVGAWGAGGTVSPVGLVLLAGEVAGFVGFVALVGSHAVRRFGTHLGGGDPHRLFAAAVGLCLGLATLASAVGLAPIVGAFLAGMVLAESRDAGRLTEVGLPVYRLFVPFFFVITGMRVDLGVFADPAVARLAICITVVAIATKLLGGVLGTAGLAARSRLIVGVGMVPRGEIGFVVVGLGRALGILPDAVFSVVVAMSLITTLIVPPVLVRLYRGPLLPLPRGASRRSLGRLGRLPGLGDGRRQEAGQ
jgi:Kef-type K+ transport system membrane component KefB